MGHDLSVSLKRITNIPSGESEMVRRLAIGISRGCSSEFSLQQRTIPPPDYIVECRGGLYGNTVPYRY